MFDLKIPNFELVEALLDIAETGHLGRATETMARNISGCVGLHATFMSANGARKQMAYALTPEKVGERLKYDFQTPSNNPMIAAAHRLPIGRLTLVERYVEMEAYLASELYQEMIEPYNTPHISTMVVPGRHGMVSFGLGQRDGVTSQSFEVAEAMAFHVARTLDLYVSAQSPGQGAFLLDPSGCLVGQSDVSIERLTNGTLRLSSIGGPVQPALKSMIPIFHNALALTASTGEGQRLICPNAEGEPNVVTISLGPPEGIRNVFWVCVERAQRLNWTETELRAIHSLTNREASVVATLLKGADIDMTAMQLGLSSRSVRTYLSNVYSKMGVGSQVELLRNLLGPN